MVKVVDLCCNGTRIVMFVSNLSLKDPKGNWRFIGIYGNPCTEKQSESWKLMERLHNLMDIPWLVGGDFNEIISDAEKNGGARRRDTQMQAFRDMIDSCALIDLGYSGDHFTWFNMNFTDNLIWEHWTDF